MEKEEIKKLNIYEKMLLIQNEIATVEKGLNVQVNAKASYKAVSERDILDAVKPIEAKYRVFSYPAETEIIHDEIVETETQYGKRSSQFLRLKRTYQFVNIDNTNEVINIVSFGDGIDTGDKATGKAMTYADKYALMKAYKISTGDDPDKEASPEQGYTKKKATPKQIEMIKKLVEDIPAMLSYFKIEKIEDLTVEQASGIIAKKGEKHD